jgi:hypothetical protein
MQPLSKNKILVRLENIADLFDADSVTKEVNLAFIQSLYADQNNGDACEFEFKEMNLSSNMALDEMLNRKIQWRTVDDDSRPDLSPSKIDYSVANQTVSLEPQRIRVFEMTVTSSAERFL